MLKIILVTYIIIWCWLIYELITAPIVPDDWEI